ncbi:EAL domain-containing protein [Yoonia sp. BS5-3]|uniref:EAL domain-containing protein n=1 Tax=Yoonia phaeophyticola TaxID=3137369 RepID=A0ABZ2V545_9RHOB
MGTTIWSTHFIAMLAYDPGVTHGYEPFLTGISLVVAVLGAGVVNIVFMHTATLAGTLLSGALFGCAVGVMHYVGMYAYLIPGYFDWAAGPKVASVLIGAALGAAAFHRAAYPVTRYCWLSGAVLMALSICALHFVGMGAMTLNLSPLFTVPNQMISDDILVILVFGITVILLAVGFATLSIEIKLEDEAVKKLQYSASHDHLTGIPNRLWLMQWFDQFAMHGAQFNRGVIAIIAIDLDRFKEVNDLRGREAGDHVLRTIASRFDAVCGTHEHIARTGGDEFIAIKTDFEIEEEVLDFGTRLQTVINEPISGKGYTHQLRGSLGVATSLHAGTDLDDLIQKADFAMYRAKEAAETSLCVYNAEMDEQKREKLLLVEDLHNAIKNDEFLLVYQLQQELVTLEPIGCEVLLRWHHPERGLVSPVEFIPIAEETGFIQELGLWVLRTACLEAATWDNALSIAVNVAPQQLIAPSFLEDLSDVLFESGLAPERLELEVTEASVISDQAATLKIIQQIKEMGIAIAMDDFGTGYSSLATLQMFPFDKIKIDRSFVTDIHNNHQRAAIVRATLLLGKSLGIPVLAEGVEQEAELQFLQKEACNYFQGFYFGQPLRREEIRAIRMDRVHSHVA